MRAKLYLFLISLLASCYILPPHTQSITQYNICIDKSFTSFENLIIKDQFKLWQYKINNRVMFKFKENCDVDVKTFIANQNDVMVLNFTKSNDFIVKLDKEQEQDMVTIGVYNQKAIKFIGLMTFRINSYDKFKKVMLHEIGHLLGLEHSGKNTVMFKHVTDQTEELTDHDIKEFCKIYRC